MVRKEELTFLSRDNETKVCATRWIPEGKIEGIIQIVHGMAEHIDRYDDFARYMAERGYVVSGEDHLGHGKTAAFGRKGFFCKQDPATVVVRDVHRLKKLNQEAYPGVPVMILGHSMGSFITRNYLFKYGTGIQGAILSGTGSQPGALIKVSLFLTGIQSLILGQEHPGHFLNHLAFGGYQKKIKNPRSEFDWLSRKNEIVDQYLMDENCGFLFTVNGFKTLFTLIDRLNRKKNLMQMPKDLPVLFLAGKEDPVGNYGKGVEKAYGQFLDLGMKQVGMKLYPGMRHEILNEIGNEEVYADILEFVKKIAKRD